MLKLLAIASSISVSHYPISHVRSADFHDSFLCTLLGWLFTGYGFIRWRKCVAHARPILTSIDNGQYPGPLLARITPVSLSSLLESREMPAYRY
jgi:hypothetical protein